MKEKIRTNEAATILGISESRLRYWADKGWLANERDENGTRWFTSEDVTSFNIDKYKGRKANPTLSDLLEEKASNLEATAEQHLSKVNYYNEQYAKSKKELEKCQQLIELAKEI
jgi:DNA-binding transcriptional MerR regulator